MDQLIFLQRQFPGAWSGGRVRSDFPLFPRLSGGACPKPAMVGTVVAAAERLQVPLANADGTSRVSGHSLRVGGAQGLTRLGFPLWSVQLMGRWGTDTVKQYVGEAALDVFTQSARPSADPLDLADLVAASVRPDPPAGRTRVVGDRATQRPSGMPQTELIEQIVAEKTAGLRDEISEALAQELRLEFARAAPAAPTTAETATETDPVWVENDRTEHWHIMAIGPGSGHPSRHWSAVCGWAFGVSDGFSIERPPPGAERCGRCLDITARRVAKADSRRSRG